MENRGLLYPLSFILYPLDLAERVGFEPTEPVKAHSISNAANSTALAPFQKITIPADCLQFLSRQSLPLPRPLPRPTAVADLHR